MSQLMRILLLITVFFTGAAVLVFEVAAMRLLAPYYGSSLTVVSSVLSTILLALSLGYFFGGRLADRYPTPRPLMIIIGAAGVCMLGLTTFALSTLPTYAPALGFVFGPLVLSALFFFIPALLLGVDSPFVSRLLATDTAAAGSAVGTVFFLSTIGSIVGSLLTGFWLIPTFGLTTTLTTTALLLILWALIVGAISLLVENRTLSTTAITVILMIALGSISLTVYAGSIKETTRGTLIHSEDGYYSKLLVFDENIRGTTYRFLKNDGNYSSAVIQNSDEAAFPYVNLALAFKALKPDTSRYLVLGSGAFTVPRHLSERFPPLQIDTVEIEPRLLPLATHYFSLPESPQLTHYTMDARVFLQSTSTKYDIIFSDVMNSGLYIPPHLLTKEFFTVVKERLSADGVALFNYGGSLDTHGVSMTGSLLKTLTTVFPNTAVYAMQSPTTKQLQNIILVVRNGNTPITFGEERVKNRLYQTDFKIEDHRVNFASNTKDDERIFTDEIPSQEPLMAKQFRLHGP